MTSTSTAKPRRRTQEERSSEMKRRILDAAFEVLKERGYAGFTTAEVAKRAGVSRGAQVHHFPSKNDLVSAAVEHVFNMSLAYGLRLAQDARQSDDPIAALLSDATTFYFSDYFYVAVDMMLAAEKDPVFKEQTGQVVANYRQPVEDEWRKVMIEQGFPPDRAGDILWLTVSILRGAGVRRLWLREPGQITTIMGVWRTIVSAYLAAGERAVPAELGVA